jgi:hypothetical protein
MMLLAQAGRWEFHHADQDFQQNANGLSLPQGPSMTAPKLSLPQFHLDLKPTPALISRSGSRRRGDGLHDRSMGQGPLKAVLQRIGGFARAPSGPMGSTPKQR